MKITVDNDEHLLRLRLRQVCEKYHSRTVQIQSVRDEIFELINSGVLTGATPALIEKLTYEVVDQWGVQKRARSAEK